MGEILRIHTLGGLRILMGDEPVTGFDSQKVAAILVYLACTRRTIPREVLAEMFWEDRTQSQSLANLRVALTSLRHTVGNFVTITRKTAAVDESANIWLDAVAFEETYANNALEQAADLYCGDFLAGFYVDSQGFEDWALRERERYRLLAQETFDRLIDQFTAHGDYATGIGIGNRLLALDTLREKTHRQLMQLLAQSGEREAALAQYEKLAALLDEELGIAPTADTQALYTQIRDGQINTSQPDHIPAKIPPKHNLPQQPTRFVGRETEISDILASLHNPDCRLLSLVGPGGIGKTRLGLAAAEQTLMQDERDVFFVSLAPLSHAEDIIQAIASAMELQISAGDSSPEEQLVYFLHDKDMLLVMDNFEHLLAGVSLIDTILAESSRVDILVTTREPLKLNWEWRYNVAGMTFPANGQDVQQLDHYSAVRLFEERACQAKQDFSLRDVAGDVVRICQLIDGMPLAIELAASWVNVLPPAIIAEEITQSLDLLETDRANVPERHRSMRAVCAPTWERLTEQERKAFVELSVFRGGFTREAAQRITGINLRTLLGLCNKSLVAQQPSSERYAIHELLRQFAEERLMAQPDHYTETRDRHSVYYFDLLLTQKEKLWGSKPVEGFEAIEAEINNIYIAWEWAVQQGNIVSINAVLDPLSFFFRRRGHTHTGATLFEQAINHLKSEGIADFLDSPVLAQLLVKWGACSWEISQFDVAKELLQQALVLCEKHDDHKGMAEALLELGRTTREGGEFHEARRLMLDAMHHARQSKHQIMLIDVLVQLGRLTGWIMGSLEEAANYLNEAKALALTSGYRFGYVRGLWNMGIIEDNQATKAGLWEECLPLAKETNDWHAVAAITNNLGEIARFKKDYVAALSYYQESSAIFDRYMPLFPPRMVPVMNMALVALEQDHLDDAQSIFLKLLIQAQSAGLFYRLLHSTAGIAAVLGKQGDLIQAVELLALVLTHPQSDRDVKQDVQPYAEQFKAELPTDEFDAAWERGSKLDLDKTIDELLTIHGVGTQLQIS